MAESPDPLRIASWNVESIRAHHDQVIAWIDDNSPDLICLQETKAGPHKFPTHAFKKRGFDLVIHGGDDGRGGVAIASKVELTDVSLGIPGAVSPLNEPRSVSATVERAGGLLRVHTCYAPNGRKVGTRAHEIKLAWFSLFAAWLEIDRVDHPHQVLIGDLNIAPLDIDIWEPHRYRKRNLTSPPERAAFDKLLADGELVDVIRSWFGPRSPALRSDDRGCHHVGQHRPGRTGSRRLDRSCSHPGGTRGLTPQPPILAVLGV